MTTRTTIIASAASLALASLVAATPASADWGHGRGYYGHHGWRGGGIAAGIIGGLALGALAAGVSSRAYAEPGYAVGPVYDAPVCHRAFRPIYDSWGRYVGDRAVRVCD